MILDQLSGKFFFTGFLLSKLRLIPIRVITSLVSTCSLIFYLVGYILWFFTTVINSNQTRNANAWYGFATINNQFQLASLLGTVASVIGLFFPSMILYAVWLSLASNTIWLIGEYHKMNTPPLGDLPLNDQRQTVYLRYAITLNIISLITALTTTIAFANPLLNYEMFMLSTIVGNLLTVLALYYWKQAAANDINNEQPATNNNYQAMRTNPRPEQSLQENHIVNYPRLFSVDRKQAMSLEKSNSDGLSLTR